MEEQQQQQQRRRPTVCFGKIKINNNNNNTVVRIGDDDRRIIAFQSNVLTISFNTHNTHLPCVTKQAQTHIMLLACQRFSLEDFR